MYVEDRDSLERLQEVARERRNTRAWTRLQAIVLAKQGDIAERIAHRLGGSRRAVPTWVAASHGGGVEAWEERPHPGRSPLLPRHEEGRFRERLDAPPCPEDEVCTLRGADIRRILEQASAASWSRSSAPATPAAGSTSCSIASATMT